MPIYSLSLYDGEDWLTANGIPKPPCPTSPKFPQFQCLQVAYNDGAKEPKDSRGRLNGACFQFEKDDDTFLQTAPTVHMASRDKLSTLIMIDPDAPDRKSKKESGEMGPYLHWFLTDCEKTAKSGKVQMEYMGPAPPKGKHRYIFVEFEQIGSVVVPPVTDRAKWDLAGFLTANKFGTPDATIKCAQPCSESTRGTAFWRGRLAGI